MDHGKMTPDNLFMIEYDDLDYTVLVQLLLNLYISALYDSNGSSMLISWPN